MRWRTESAVGLLNLSTIAAGFLLQIVVIRLAAAPRDADVYFAVAAIPQLVLSIVSALVAGAMLPQIARVDGETQSATVWTLLALTFACGLPLGLALSLSSSAWASWIFPGFSEEATYALSTLAGLTALSLPFVIANCILAGYLYAQHRFILNEMVALATAVCLLGSVVLLLPSHAIVVVGWLVLARFVAQFLILASFLPRWKFKAGFPIIKQIGRRTRTLLAGTVYFKSDILADRILLSLAPAGALSTVVLGQSVFNAASGALGQALSSTVAPKLSVAHEAKDRGAFIALLRRNLRLIGVVAILLVIGCLAIIPPLAGWMTDGMVERGPADLQTILLLLSGVPIGACLGGLLAAAFYAMGDTRTPTLMSVCTFTVFLIAKISVFLTFGLYAFCAVISLYYLTNAAIMAFLLPRKITREFAA